MWIDEFRKNNTNFIPERYSTAQLGKTLKMKAHDTCEVQKKMKREKSQVVLCPFLSLWNSCDLILGSGHPYRIKDWKVVLNSSSSTTCAVLGPNKAHLHCERKKTKIFLNTIFVISSQQMYLFRLFFFSLFLKIGLIQIRSLDVLTFHWMVKLCKLLILEKEGPD